MVLGERPELLPLLLLREEPRDVVQRVAVARRLEVAAALLRVSKWTIYRWIEEGRLRESVRLSGEGADGYDSLIVMSMLDREYQARVALGQEA